MKEQQVRQDTRQQEKQKSRETESRKNLQEQIPMQVLAGLLTGKTDLRDLPVPLIEVLARSVGNSALTDLLRGLPGSGGPVLREAERPQGMTGLAPNEIEASAPLLTAPVSPESVGGGRPWSVSPFSIQERAGPEGTAYQGMT